MKNIFILALNDFACSLRNKSFYLVFFIPVFIFIIFKMLDRNTLDISKFKIGLIQNVSYTPQLLAALPLAEKNLEASWFQNAGQALLALKEQKVDAVLEPKELNAKQVALLVLKKDTPGTLALSQIFSTLQNTVEKNNGPWVTEIKSLREGNIQKQTLPTWILMVVLLVGFIILPAQVAEEKEKKLLLALLQTPIHEVEWIVGKIMLGIFLAGISILLLHSLNHVVPINLFLYSTVLLVGCFCFSAFGIFLGFLCRNQASARTLGVIFYLPLLVPVALSDFSKKMGGILAILPSYRLYDAIQNILFESSESASLFFSGIYLFLLGSFFLGASYILLKKRWLM